MRRGEAPGGDDPETELIVLSQIRDLLAERSGDPARVPVGGKHPE
jgi:hypothetical protein